MSRFPSTRAAALLLTALLVASLAGCGGEKKPASSLSEAQRDTVLSKSDIPGAGAVGKAFEVSGREASHAAQLDSLAH